MPTIAEVREHNTKEDCWVIIHNKVYDVSDFIDEHPGGAAIILKYAGKDATKAFDPIHPSDTLDKYLASEYHLGELTAAEGETVEEDEEEPTEEDLKLKEMQELKPPLSQMYNLMDFEHVAKHTMMPTAWAYYSSGCDDEMTLRLNHLAYHQIKFNPRVLRDVTNIDLSTEMLGTSSSLPFYITATALGKLGHPDGETVLTRAAATTNIIQMIPTLASCSFDEIMDAATPEQTQWFQLYVNSNREITQNIIKHAENRGIKGLFITVDAPQLGRREKDMRSKSIADISSIQEETDDNADRSQGAARAISSFIDTNLTWSDIATFKSITNMPIALKGVQCVEDVLLAIEAGADAVVLSNHGGRQLEGSKPPIQVLAEVHVALKEKGLKDRIEIYIDGGVRRGTDILKALCLGAKGVGLGRPFLYAMSTYGQAGVEKACKILEDELIMNMRMLGVTSIDQLNESYVDIRGILSGNGVMTRDYLFEGVYEPMIAPLFKAKM